MSRMRFLVIIILVLLFSSCNSDLDDVEWVNPNDPLADTSDNVNTVDALDIGETMDIDYIDDTDYTEETVDIDDAGEPCVGDFPHEHDNLCWSAPSSNQLDHAAAISYCENIDGHLPTIGELRQLIQHCANTVVDGACGIKDNCLEGKCWSEACDGCADDNSGKYSVFGDTEFFWSSSVFADNLAYAWRIGFSNGKVDNWDRVGNIWVRCVR